MNGIHDLGGMHGFGPVVREEHEPAFHEPWEKTVWAMQQATRIERLFNIDEFRHGIERMEPRRYLEASYYEKWLESIAVNLVEKGVLTPEEISARLIALQAADGPATRPDDPTLVARILAPRTPRHPALVDQAPPPRFRVGDEVITRNDHPLGHTRLPRYVRGKRGTVDRLQGIQVFPDTNAHGRGENPQMVYSVRFAGRELWGDSAEPDQVLYIDLWESYLEQAGVRPSP